MLNRQIDERLVVVVPTSPIKSHPDTSIIDRTLNSIRWQLGPNVMVVILADGVRPELEHLRKPYEQYLEELENRYCEEPAYFVMKFLNHVHQVGMLRWLMGCKFMEKPPMHVSMVEHDCPYTPDPIDWENVCDLLDTGKFEMIRFLYEGDINDAHRHMAGETSEFKGMNYVETRQFSARPHVATWAFYKRALEQFSPNANTFLEDKMHGVVLDNPAAWKIAYYYPPPPRGRSFHLDGRQGDAKFDEKQVF